MATPGYFTTLGLPLVAGREFSAQDAVTAPRVVIINESLARSAWPGQDPVGRSLILDYQGGATPRQIVGAAWSATRGTTARAANRRRRSSSRTRRTRISS
jgi:hypothetical protein